MLLDTVGCMVGGWSAAEAAPMAALLRARSAPDGPGLVTGSGFRASREIAAMANGTLAGALHYDDVSRFMGGHPSAPVAAAIVAECGAGRRTGDAALGAYVLGIETSVRIGHALGRGHGARGWHTTATAGVFGAAAAVAHLQGLKADECAQAIGMSASFASGLKSAFKTMTRSLHDGWAAHSGLLAANLVQAGLSGPADGLETAGLLAVLGSSAGEADGIIEGFGTPWTFEAPGDGLKVYPCHGATHRALDAALVIRARAHLTPAGITAVRCYNPPPWFQWVPRLIPRTGEEARFSMEYILAAALTDGIINQMTFTDAAVSRAVIRDLYPKIQLFEDPRFMPADPYGGDPARPPYEGYVRLEVDTINGDTISHEVEYPPGAPGRYLDARTVEEKFLDCASTLGGVSRDRVQAFARAFRSLDRVEDFGALLGTLSVPR